MEKKFNPRGKERKRTNRKKWYKAVCSLAAAVVVCTVYTLMLPALTLDEKSAGDVVTISESSVATSEAPAAESSKSDNGSESQNDTAADSSADSSHAATESGPAAAAPSDDRATSTTNPTTEGEHNAPVTLPTEETNSGAITGSSESQDEVTSPDTNDQEKIKDEENNGSPAADQEKTDQEEADNSGSSSDTDADTEEDDSEKSDDTADVEDASYWETTIPDLSDCETWAEKLLAVAGSQLGYHESILNFRVDNDGNHKGYTRYGEWYGNPYGDWCAMFVSFCLKYAGIDEEAIPQNANCSDWVKNLKNMEIYEDADLYVPEAGDIVFFDQSDADRPNHVGIISEVTYGTKTVIRHITKDGSAIESGAMNALKYINEATSDDASGDELRTEEVEVPVAESIKVIEGNSSDQVQYVDYDLSNEKILGYVSMTNAKNVYEGVEEQKPVEEQEIEPLKYEGSDYVIKVEYTEEAQLPEGVHLEAEELREGTEAYEDYYNRTVEKLMDESTAENEDDLGISFARFFDLKFITTEGEEIEPAAPVSVKIRYTDRVEVNDDQAATVVHFAKTTATAETDDSWTSKSDIATFNNEESAAVVSESNEPTADAEENIVEESGKVVEVPEIIEPEAITNSTFEFEQGSFSVTATVIRNASNASNGNLENNSKYIIYIDEGKILEHDVNNNKLVVTNEPGFSIENDKTYDDSQFPNSMLWTYSDNNLYYEENGEKYYLTLKQNRYYEYSYSVEIANEPDNELEISDGKITKSFYEKKYWWKEGEEVTKKVYLNNSRIELNSTGTKFNFAKIEKSEDVVPPEIQQKLTHYKYVEPRDDGTGTYDLTLTVTGAKGTATKKAKLDVIFVVDISTSMNNSFSGGTTKLKKAKSAINTMADSLNKNGNLDVTYSLISFSGFTANDYYNGYGSGNESPWNDADTLVNTGNLTDLKTQVNSLKADGGTNYEAGIRNANAIVSRSGAQKAIIFVSDGNPGYYYNINGYTKGTPNPRNDYDENAMEMAQKEISKSDADYFYTIGVGENTSDYQYLSFLTDESKYPKEFKIKVPAANRNNYSATEDTSLENAFASIQSNITEVRCTNVTIEDVLSEYVQRVGNADLILNVKNVKDDKTGIIKSGKNTLTFNDKLNSNAETESEIRVNASYVTAEKKIVMSFEPAAYEINPDYEFTVTLNIEPTELAKTTYVDQAYTYLVTGDEGTGSKSSNQGGFYSNKMDENNKTVAKVTYKYSGGKDFETELYPKPVIQVDIEPVELPETGGPGTTLLYLLGAMLITAPLTITFIKRRRQEEEEN